MSGVLRPYFPFVEVVLPIDCSSCMPTVALSSRNMLLSLPLNLKIDLHGKYSVAAYSLVPVTLYPSFSSHSSDFSCLSKPPKRILSEQVLAQAVWSLNKFFNLVHKRDFHYTPRLLSA